MTKQKKLSPVLRQRSPRLSKARDVRTFISAVIDRDGRSHARLAALGRAALGQSPDYGCVEAEVLDARCAAWRPRRSILETATKKTAPTIGICCSTLLNKCKQPATLLARSSRLPRGHSTLLIYRSFQETSTCGTLLCHTRASRDCWWVAADLPPNDDDRVGSNASGTFYARERWRAARD